MNSGTDLDPWVSAPLSLWRNNDLDPRRFAAREALVRHAAKEQKLHEAIEFGRIYGLGEMYYRERRRQKLEHQLKTAVITAPHW
jgi:hypothetical protein